MRGSQTPPLEVSAALRERLDAERLSITLTGTWLDPSGAARRLTLAVDADGRRHRFPAVPRPRQTVGGAAPHFEARFTVPASLEAVPDEAMKLLVGEAEVALPGVESAPPSAPDLLSPVHEELADRARVESQLRAEIAVLRTRVDARGAPAERLEAVRRELAEELVRVRSAVAAHESRRGEVESRAIVLAAELSEAQRQREEIAAELEARQAECEQLRSQVAELESALTTVRREAIALRTAELSARTGREAALAEVEALHGELESHASGGAVAEGEAGDPELERAEALLAEARALTESLA